MIHPSVQGQPKHIAKIVFGGLFWSGRCTPIPQWIIEDYPVAQATEAYQLVGDFLAEQFADPGDKGTAALTEQDIEAVRMAASRKLKSRLKSAPEIKIE